MSDESVLVAIDEALHLPAYCSCGRDLSLSTRADGLWLECPAFEAPSRLPATLARSLRALAHVRRFVIDLPTADRAADSTRPDRPRVMPSPC